MQHGSISPPPNSSSCASLALSAGLHHTKQKAQENLSILLPRPAVSCLTDSIPSSPATAVHEELTSLLLFSFHLPSPCLPVPKSFTLLQKQSCHSILLMSGHYFDSFQSFPLPRGQSPSSLEYLLGSPVGQISNSLSLFCSLLMPNVSLFPCCLAFAAQETLCGIPESRSPLRRCV